MNLLLLVFEDTSCLNGKRKRASNGTRICLFVLFDHASHYLRTLLTECESLIRFSLNAS